MISRGRETIRKAVLRHRGYNAATWATDKTIERIVNRVMMGERIADAWHNEWKQYTSGLSVWHDSQEKENPA